MNSSETVVYLGTISSVWGHFLTDSIRHLWFLKSEEFKSNFKDCRLIYVPWNCPPLEQLPNFRRLLEILEVGVDKFQAISQPTCFDKIILPDGSFFPNTRFTNEYRELIDIARNFALKNKTPTSCKKIYYYRKRGLQTGEERLAEYFRSKGYEIISPEKLTVDEQLNLLINCESFAATLGSISHNIIFLRENSEAIIIPRTATNSANGYQKVLNQIYSWNINYVDSTLSVYYHQPLNVCYVISEHLKRFFGDKWAGYDEDDYKAFLEHVKNGINRDCKINLNEVNGYGKVFEDFMTQLKKREDLIATYNLKLHNGKFRVPLTYQTHSKGIGWMEWRNENEISSPLSTTRELQAHIEAIRINFPGYKLYYSIYYNEEESLQEDVTNCQMAGTTGKSKPIYGMRVRLDEDGSKEFDILYRMHKFDDTWTPWAKNGETLYSYGVKLNAIQIKLESKT